MTTPDPDEVGPDEVARCNEVRASVNIEGRVYGVMLRVPPVEMGLNLHQLGHALDMATDAVIRKIGEADRIPGPYPPRVPDPNDRRAKPAVCSRCGLPLSSSSDQLLINGFFYHERCYP